MLALGVKVVPPWFQRENGSGMTNFALHQRGADIRYSHQPKKHYYLKGLIDVYGLD